MSEKLVAGASERTIDANFAAPTAIDLCTTTRRRFELRLRLQLIDIDVARLIHPACLVLLRADATVVANTWQTAARYPSGI